MKDTVTFDHTSLAVENASRWARWIRRKLGATPLLGEVLPEFRYVVFHVGEVNCAARLELLAPAQDGFLRRFIDRHGEAPHHLTFLVPDVEQVQKDVERIGLTTVGTELSHPPWRETFIAPDGVHGTVIQAASSIHQYPNPNEITKVGVPMWPWPSNKGAKDGRWWVDVSNVPVERVATLGATVLVSTDLTKSRALFGDVLGGHCTVTPTGLTFTWYHQHLVVVWGTTPGIRCLHITGGPWSRFRIGDAQMVAPV